MSKKICNFEGCNNNCFYRKRQCELHYLEPVRKKNKYNVPEDSWYESIENRILMKEQEKEYNEAIIKDLENFRQKEAEKEFEKIKITEINERCLSEENEMIKFFNIKIKLLNNDILYLKLSVNSRVQTMFDFVEIYYINNKLKYSSFSLIKNFPFLTLDSSSLSVKLLDLNFGNSAVFYMKNLN